MVSKLDELYAKVLNTTEVSNIQIPSRCHDVALVHDEERLKKRTWQQHDFFVFSCWLPARVGIRLNLDKYYQVNDTKDYARLSTIYAKDQQQSNQLLTAYLAFAMIKNFLLFQQINIESLDPRESDLSRANLASLLQLPKVKEEMLLAANTAKEKLLGLGYQAIADELHKEILNEFKERESSLTTVLATKTLPTSPITPPVLLSNILPAAPPPSPAASPSPPPPPPPQPPMLQVPLTPPPSPQPSLHLSLLDIEEDDSLYNSTISESGEERLNLGCGFTVPIPQRCMVMFSSCLSFLAPEPRNYEMIPLAEGYVQMRDDVTVGRGPNNRQNPTGR